MANIHKHAHDAGLSPLLTRIAVILSDIEGDASAKAFIESVQEELVEPLEHQDAFSPKQRQQVRILEA